MARDQNKIEACLTAALEELAAIEHQRWSHWQKYMHSKGKRLPDGTLIIPAELVSKWDEQSSTDYNDLSEKEKESDREQVRLYLPVIVRVLSGSTDNFD